MRRKDREMSEEFALEIIDKSRYGILSMIDGEAPYGIPLSMVRDGKAIYFHSAMDGRKVQALNHNQRVSATFVGEVHVPDNYTKEQLDEIAADESRVVTFISNVFTTEFEADIKAGQGRANVYKKTINEITGKRKKYNIGRGYIEQTAKNRT